MQNNVDLYLYTHCFSLAEMGILHSHTDPLGSNKIFRNNDWPISSLLNLFQLFSTAARTACTKILLLLETNCLILTCSVN